MKFQNIPVDYLNWITNFILLLKNDKFDKKELEAFEDFKINLSYYKRVRNLKQLYKEVRFNQSWSSVDQRYPAIIEHSNIINAPSDSEIKGSIIVTYHTGSYRMINVLLIRYNVDIVLVVDRNFSTQQAQTSHKMFNNAKKYYKSKSNLQIVNAEEKSGFYEIIKTLKKKNKIVLFYIDGNTGLKKDSSDFSINFLGKDAYVRRGIAYLSQKFENNIIPVVNTRNKWIGSEFKFLKTIRPTKKVNFVKDTTQYLYKILEDFLDNHPEQWEGWLYINKFFDDPYIKTTKYKLNNGLEIKQSNDKNYLVYNELLKKPISNELYSILDYINDKNGIKFKDIRIGNHLYTKKSIMDLVKKQVII